MGSNCQKIISLCIAVGGLLAGQSVVAGGRFSQLVLTFPNERAFKTSTDETKNSITIHLSKTSPGELDALDHFDERLIRRVLIKDLGPLGTDVEFVFRDRNVKAAINKFAEPFRIAIDLFDRDYEQDVDPESGLPLLPADNLVISGPSTQEANKKRLLRTTKDQSSGQTQVESPASPLPLEGVATADSSSKRRLLQPTPENIQEPGALERLIISAPEGRAKPWSDYPIYVYPMQTAAYEGRTNPAGWVKSEATKALSSTQAMAEYAFKLFSFGHDARALLAYQQVLYRDGSVFAKDALHLWAFAESHLAHGNLTLAEGYYETLVEKHPDSALSKFAAMRRLDTKAIRLLQANRQQDLSELLADLAKIDPTTSGELRSQLAIRKAYWNQQGIEGDGRGKYVPIVSTDIESTLKISQSTMESQRTAFIGASILLKNLLRSDRPWTDSTGTFAEQYFKTYKGPSSEPIYTALKDQLHARLSDHIMQLYAKNQFAEAIHSYEALPGPLKSISKDSTVAWAIAESYRAQEDTKSANTFYEQAASGATSTLRKFQTQFWISVLSATLANQAAEKGQSAQQNALLKRSRTADQEAKRQWTMLADDDKFKLVTAYKTHLEKAVQSPLKLRTPADIVLETWTKGLSSRMDGSNGEGENQWTRSYSPTSSSVYLLGQLSKKFDELGELEKKRQSVRIMRAIKPEELANDKAAREVWNKELLALAEEYRKDNNYLEAGRLLAFTAKNSGEVSSRAENLYKGGLLLFRSGQREEAIEAFTMASEDGNNIFYANLAKERLSQLKN